MTRIIDTSVVIKWVVREEGSDAAAALIGEELAAPDLLRAECANALWKKVRRNEITSDQAVTGFSAVLEMLHFVPSKAQAMPALKIGLELGHPIYDCYFLALAETLGVPFITADQRLIARVADSRFEPMIEPLEARP